MTGENDSNIKGGRTTNDMRTMKKQQKNIRRIFNESKKREQLIEREQTKILRIDSEANMTTNAYDNADNDGTRWTDTDSVKVLKIYRYNGYDKKFTETLSKDTDDEPEIRRQELMDAQSIDTLIRFEIVIHGIVLECNDSVYVIRPNSYYIQQELKNDLYVMDKSEKFKKQTNVYFTLEKISGVLCAKSVKVELEEQI